jgi:hypothetical protein
MLAIKVAVGLRTLTAFCLDLQRCLAPLSLATVGLQRAKAQGRVGGRPRIEHGPRTMAKLADLKGAALQSGELPESWV